ncbi:MAG: N-acetylmuramoyl-L-alanine amidase [Lachnospiraceae bacterium]|nr:N-acetylmuramoyl-L-alanine amidase [Lachnospiraceae bacterium]
MKRNRRYNKRHNSAADIIIALILFCVAVIVSVALLLVKNEKKSSAVVKAGSYETNEHEQKTGRIIKDDAYSNEKTDEYPEAKTQKQPEETIKTEKTAMNTSKSKRILLDAGHGFGDPVTSSDFLGCSEKDVTIRMAKLLKAELESRGYEVDLTHDGETFTSEQEIMKMADKKNLSYKAEKFETNRVFSAYERTIYANVLNAENKYSLFVSLHVNALEKGNASGFQLDYCCENAYSPASKVAAESIKNSLESNFPDTRMKYKEDTYDDAFIVTKYSEMPSLLLEMGYATDEGDAAKLNDAGWCSLFIKAVADGIEAGI